MIDDLKEVILEHVKAEYPREACGLAIIFKGKLKYIPCKNNAIGTEHFILDAEDYAKAEDMGEVVALIHSHPNASANASEADFVSCEATKLPWYIVGWPSGVWVNFEPSGYVAPLVGRNFHHGVLDCYTLIQDYYLRELGNQLPNFVRHDNWWVAKDGKPPENLYVENFAKAGFEVVSGPPEKHDVLLMMVGADVPNHAAIYLGDEVILHHLHGRLSSRDQYAGYYDKHTTHILRYRG